MRTGFQRSFLLSLILAAAFAPGTTLAATIYHTIQGSQLGVVDTDTGIATNIGPFGISSTFGNVFDHDGTMFASAGSSQLGTVDLNTGAISVLGPLPTSTYALEIDSAGTLYALGRNGILYSLDKGTGAGTAIGNTGISNAMDLAFDSNDNLYATVGGVLYSIDENTGAVTNSVSTSLGAQNMGIMFDANDVLWATLHISGSGLYTLDPVSGAGTLVHASGMAAPHGGDIAPIPEPGTALLMGLGLGGLSLAGRRR